MLFLNWIKNRFVYASKVTRLRNSLLDAKHILAKWKLPFELLSEKSIFPMTAFQGGNESRDFIKAVRANNL
jgi:hypothetical protein